MMDLKFKKLLILAMRTNDANHLRMEFSPKKRIDMQLFASVFIHHVQFYHNSKYCSNIMTKLFVILGVDDGM